MGVVLPEGVVDDVADAILARLRQAEAEEEEDIFTGEAFVRDGRAAEGLSAIVRRGLAGVHVFLYDDASIRQWQQLRGTDPATRERFTARDIIPLTADPPAGADELPAPAQPVTPPETYVSPRSFQDFVFWDDAEMQEVITRSLGAEEDTELAEAIARSLTPEDTELEAAIARGLREVTHV